MSLSLEFAGEQLSNKFWFEFFELSNKLWFNQADMGRYVKLSNIRKGHFIDGTNSTILAKIFETNFSVSVK